MAAGSLLLSTRCRVVIPLPILGKWPAMIEVRSLRRRIVKAGLWTLGGHSASQVLRLASNLALTRLLMPDAFGVMAIANSFLLGLALFSDVGLRQNIIHSKRGNDSNFSNTVWTLQIARGGIIWLLMLLLAVGIFFGTQTGIFAVDSVYARPELPWIICVLAFTAIIAGFESTKLGVASRDLDIALLTRIELLSQLGALVCMVGWAYHYKSVWALVGGAIMSTTIKVALSHTLLPGQRNKLCWDSSAVSEVLGYGKWIFISSVLGFLAANGDKFILGGLINATSLGMYAIAFFIIDSLRQIFTKISGNVAFPTFCEVIRSRPTELKFTYYKFRLPIDLSSLFATGVLFSSGHLLTDFMYDSRYHDVGYMFEILSISMFEIRYSLASQCFMALGLPKLLTPLIGIRLIVLFVFLPMAYNYYGMTAALWVVGGNVLFTLPLVIYYKIKYKIFNLKYELIVLPMALAGYIVGNVAVYLTTHLLSK